MKIALVAQNATPLSPRAGSGPESDDIGLSELTRKLLGWEPTHPGLIADLDEGHYFTS